MKIKGPGPGFVPPPPPEPSSTDKVGSGKPFAAHLEKPAAAPVEKSAAVQSPAPVGAVTESSAAKAPSLTHDLASRLKTGQMTPAEAMETLVSRLVDRQVGVNAPAAIREQVGAALRSALSDDPLLQAKVKALSQE